MGNKLLCSKPKGLAKNEQPRTNKRRGSLLALRRAGNSIRRMSWAPRQHLDVRTWLAQIDLASYAENFKKYGGVEEFLYVDESVLRDELDVQVASHRRRIISSLVHLQNKFEKNQKLKVDPCVRASLIECDPEQSALRLHLDISPSVVLRSRAKSSDRHNAQKREATVIGTVKINGEMPLVKESITTMPTPPPPVPPPPDPGDLELKKALEAELSLASSDLRSHAWYHGSVSRERAEEVVTQNGAFIIRDCISQPGDFVLTCRWNDQVIHVIIQKVICQPDTIYERVQYQLEAETYDSIPDLVTAYVGGRKVVTSLSGSRISTPVPRAAPLSYYASKYAAHTSHTRLHGTLSRTPKPTHNRSSAYSQPTPVSCTIVRTSQSPPRMRRESGSVKGGRPTSGFFEDRQTSCSGDGILGSPRTTNGKPFSTYSLPRRFQASSLSLPPINDAHLQPDRRLSDMTREGDHPPPPKPSRVPSTRIRARQLPSVPLSPPISLPLDNTDQTYAEIDEEDDQTPIGDVNKISTTHVEGIGVRLFRLSDVYQTSGSDSGHGSGDSVLTANSDYKNRDSQTSFGDSGFVPTEEDIAEEEAFLKGENTEGSAFDLEAFSTLLLPPIDNRPLDATALKGVKNALNECGSRTLAAHLTKVDLDLLNGRLRPSSGLGETVGIELVTLPQGSQLRRDLIERTECLRLLVVVSILQTEDLLDRADIIYRWIQVAIDAKTAMGNLFGFTAIMLGLCAPEVQRLNETWQKVRKQYTDSAFKFESKLRSTLKAMNECSYDQAPNTTIPHLLPYILIWERDLDDIYALHTKGSSLLQWEGSSSDYGLNMVFRHLQEGRAFIRNLDLFRRNAELIVGDAHLDELTLDVFRTEFHLKFLFGSKAALADTQQRMFKFNKVIATLSEFCEPSKAEC